MSNVMCHVSCHVSCVTCHVSRVTCHMSIFFFGRVCYQRGLPRLVFFRFEDGPSKLKPYGYVQFTGDTVVGHTDVALIRTNQDIFTVNEAGNQTGNYPWVRHQ